PETQYTLGLSNEIDIAEIEAAWLRFSTSLLTIASLRPQQSESAGRYNAQRRTRGNIPHLPDQSPDLQIFSSTLIQVTGCNDRKTIKDFTITDRAQQLDVLRVCPAKRRS